MVTLVKVSVCLKDDLCIWSESFVESYLFKFCNSKMSLIRYVWQRFEVQFMELCNCNRRIVSVNFHNGNDIFLLPMRTCGLNSIFQFFYQWCIIFFVDGFPYLHSSRVPHSANLPIQLPLPSRLIEQFLSFLKQFQPFSQIVLTVVSSLAYNCV